MFGRKKDGAKISDKIPVFHVRYIGNTETFVANGRGCSYAPVQRLWDNAPDEKHLRKVAIYLSQSGITMKDAEKKEELIGHYSIENISFCNTDRGVNERIFSWICRNTEDNRLDCHAVLCSTKQKAQTMAVVLSRAFQVAYKDWKSHARHREMARTTAALSGHQKGGGGGGVNGHVGGGGAPSPKPHSKGPGVTSGAMSSPQASDTGASSSMTSSASSPGMNGAAASPAGRPKHMTSSKYEQPSTSSGFMTNSILDPDVEDAMRKVTVGEMDTSFDAESD